MPAHSLLLSVAICFAFLLFAVVVAWIDYSTSQWLRAKAVEKHAGESEQSYRKAA
jgi:hypothetical protein